MAEKTKVQFSKLATDAISTVDEFRSTGALPASSDNNSSVQVESRTNTFYRLLGLPAFTDLTSFEEIDKYNNGNLFRVGREIDSAALKTILSEVRHRNFQFSTTLDDDEVDKFLRNNSTPVNAGVVLGAKKKGGLFPLAVDGAFSIQPSHRRIAAPFLTSKEVSSSGVNYKRPLLELIALMRTKAEGNADTTLVQDLNEDIDALVGSDNSINIINPNIAVLEGVRSLVDIVLTADGVQSFINTTISNVSKVNEQISDIFPDSKELTIAAEMQKRERRENQTGVLEKAAAAREEALAVERLNLKLLEYDDTLSQKQTRNMKDAVLASTVLSMISAETSEIKEQTKEDETKTDMASQILRVSNQNLELILGSYGGLSGIDVMVILTSLFLLPLDILLSLFNEQSYIRLQSIRPNVSSQTFTVEAALGELETVVTTLYDSLQDKIIQKKILKPTDEAAV